jgi:hypothetical protein
MYFRISHCHEMFTEGYPYSCWLAFTVAVQAHAGNFQAGDAEGVGDRLPLDVETEKPWVLDSGVSAQLYSWNSK